MFKKNGGAAIEPVTSHPQVGDSAQHYTTSWAAFVGFPSADMMMKQFEASLRERRRGTERGAAAESIYSTCRTQRSWGPCFIRVRRRRRLSGAERKSGAYH